MNPIAEGGWLLVSRACQPGSNNGHCEDMVGRAERSVHTRGAILLLCNYPIGAWPMLLLNPILNLLRLNFSQVVMIEIANL